MRIKLSFSYSICFLLLLIVMMELHEIIHITVGYIICGCWGNRDFNFWALCDTCNNPSLSWLATLAGPVFSFSMMWWGRSLLSAKKAPTKALGFSLIFANIPFGRITEVMKGSGDEMLVAKHFLKPSFTHTQIITIASVIILFVGIPPIIKAFCVLANKNALLFIVGFLTLPLVFILLYILVAMNSLLHTRLLSFNWIMGTPLMITLHTLLAMGMLWLLRKNIFSLNN